MFTKMEKLVSYAVGGEMERKEVSSVVSQLKAEKAEIFKSLLKMPEGKERKAAFKRLNDLTYRLYDAVVCVGKDEYVSMSVMANMILCYDCR